MMERTKKTWSIFSVIVLLICGITITACGSDDENGTDGDDTTVSNRYKASDLYGVWAQTQSENVNGIELYNHADDQYGITFQNDGIHGRKWNVRIDGTSNWDFKWIFKNDWIHIELDTGHEFDCEIVFLDSRKLVLDYGRGESYWRSDTYVKN